MPTQMQSGPHESSRHFPAGQTPVETQRVRPPSGLTQVQPVPHESTVQGSAEQVSAARQRRLTPPISRHTQPGPQDVSDVHCPAGQVLDSGGGGGGDSGGGGGGGDGATRVRFWVSCPVVVPRPFFLPRRFLPRRFLPASASPPSTP